MIGCHVVECRQVVRLDFDIVDDILRHLFSIRHLGVKFASMRGHDAIEIHIILSQRTSLIEAAKLDDATHNDLILRDTEYLLQIHPLECVDDAEGHADWKCRWHSNQDNVDELNDDIAGNLVRVVDDSDDAVED